MAGCPLPWFPIYASEMLGDENFAVWDPAQRGCWVTLIARCWVDGSIPDDLDLLARLCGCNTDAMRSHWSRIADRFQPHSLPGRLISPRVELERTAAIEKAEKMSANGKSAALRRWQKEKNSNAPALPTQSESNAGGMRIDASSPSPSPSSSLRSEECGEVENASPPLMPVESVATLPCAGKGPREWPITQSNLNEWAQAFPGVNALGEITKMRLWLKASPERMKTYRGMGKFVLGWLGRAQNDSRGRPSVRAPAGYLPRRCASADADHREQLSAMDPFPTLPRAPGATP